MKSLILEVNDTVLRLLLQKKSMQITLLKSRITKEHNYDMTVIYDLSPVAKCVRLTRVRCHVLYL